MSVMRVVRSVAAVLAVAVVLAGCTAGPGDVSESPVSPRSTPPELVVEPEPEPEPEAEADEWTGWFDPDAPDVFEYPITPEDEEWAEYVAVELWPMLEVPAETLEQMSTSGLLITAMTHPFFASLLVYDSPPEALVASLRPEIYGALAVFLDRPDGPGTLLDYYRRPEVWVRVGDTWAHDLHVLLGLDQVVGALGRDGRTAMVAAMVATIEADDSELLLESARWAVMRALQIDSPAFAEAVAADEELVGWLDPQTGLRGGWWPDWDTITPVFIEEVAAVYGVHVGDTLGFAG